MNIENFNLKIFLSKFFFLFFLYNHGYMRMRARLIERASSFSELHALKSRLLYPTILPRKCYAFCFLLFILIYVKKKRVFFLFRELKQRKRINALMAFVISFLHFFTLFSTHKYRNNNFS